jgi:hypothetical protein
LEALIVPFFTSELVTLPDLILSDVTAFARS